MTEQESNPYESPKCDESAPKREGKLPPVIAWGALLFLAALAATGAFFLTCVGTLLFGSGLNLGNSNGAIVVVVSSLAAILAAIRVIWKGSKTIDYEPDN